MRNGLKCVLEKIFHQQVRVWNYEDDFDQLWKLLDTKKQHLDGKHVVLWSQTPPGNCYPVRTDPFVSPIVWAVCAAACLPTQESLRVTIVDLAPAVHLHDHDEPLRSQIAVIKEERIPWLKVVLWTDLVKDNATEIEKALLTTSESTSLSQTGQGVTLDQLRQTLRFKLTNSGSDNRHAISNLVGPMLLLKASQEAIQRETSTSNAAPADHVTAINQVLSVCGLMRKELLWPSPSNAAVDTEDRGRPLDLTEWTRANGGIEFILVDDQIRNGWGQVVCEMLGGSPISPTTKTIPTMFGTGCNGKLIVSVSESADCILRELEKPGSSDRRYEVCLGSAADHQVLLLDLRLFAGKPLHEEAEFYFRLHTIARQRFCGREGQLPWPGFTVEELDRLESWLISAKAGAGGDRRDSVYLEILTLLPRVIALSDLSLPIVLFSSTIQRKITDSLADYRNIVIGFSKPAVHGYDSSDLRTETHVRFYGAVERALGLCKARALCRNMLNLAKEADKYTINRRSDKSVVHYELYVDESGCSVVEGDLDARPDEPGRFTVGGILVEYKESLGPEDLHARMELQDPPLRWWPKTPGGAFLAKSGKPLDELPNGALKRSEHEVIQRFLQLVSSNSAIGVCLEYRDDGPAKPEDEVEAITEADNRYRRMLSCLLEAVLFDLLPEIVVNKNATLSVFVATRVRTAREFCGGAAVLARLMDRFGFDGNLNVAEPYVQTMDEPFVVSILSEIKKRRPDEKLTVKLEHVRGVVLCYPEKGGRTSPKWDNTRHQHYLADIVARMGRRIGSQLQHNQRELFKRGIYDIFDERFVALTQSARAMSRGDISTAVLELENFDFGAPIPKTASSWSVIKRLRKTLLQEFSGSDFIDIAMRIGRPRVVGRQESEGETGAVMFFNPAERYGVIRSQGRDCKFFWRDWRSATQPRRGESVRFVRVSRPDYNKDRVEWVQSLT